MAGREEEEDFGPGLGPASGLDVLGHSFVKMPLSSFFFNKNQSFSFPFFNFYLQKYTINSYKIK